MSGPLASVFFTGKGPVLLVCLTRGCRCHDFHAYVEVEVITLMATGAAHWSVQGKVSQTALHFSIMKLIASWDQRFSVFTKRIL